MESEDKNPTVVKLLDEYFALETQKQQRLKPSEGYRRIVNPENGNYYFLTRAVTSWPGAHAEARRVGGNLATIRNQSEQNWLRNNFPLDFWIGLTDAGHEGHWRWVSGEPVTYHGWRPGEPNNSGGIEHYAEFNPHHGGWNDVPLNRWGSHYIPGVVEVYVKDLEDKQRHIANQLLAYANQHGSENLVDLHRIIEVFQAQTEKGSNKYSSRLAQLKAAEA
ncbi:C-type lectin domain-containing protein, partial [Hydrocoleum sp. CS-953]|uniref:C-type lectin domain-containing protein n=1 Tax=Hydrocoleum sp. CS-953 TaxID=1671698 RepID=UPI00352B1AD2